MDVFMLYHIYEQKDDFGVHDEEKLIGIFSSEANAQGAIEHLKDKEGFRDRPLSCLRSIRQRWSRISWEDGFAAVRWKESE